MDVLMDLERMHVGAGEALIDEFFPGGLDEARGEKEWWNDVSKRVVYSNQGKIPAASDRPALATNTIVAGSLIGTYDQKRLQHPTRAKFGLHTYSEYNSSFALSCLSWECFRKDIMTSCSAHTEPQDKAQSPRYSSQDHSTSHLQ